MVYSDTHKFVYYCNPKTASTSITNVLIRYFGAKVYHGKHGRHGFIHPDDPRDRHDTTCPQEFQSYYQFSSVRHPFDRAVSGYAAVAEGKKKTVLEVFAHFHMVSQVDYLYTYDFHVADKVPNTALWSEFATKPGWPRRLDGFVRVESLEDDFAALPFVGKRVSFPKTNKGQRGWKKKVPADEIWDYIKSHMIKDAVEFGYEMQKKERQKLL